MSETTALLARLIGIETCDPPGGEIEIARLVRGYLDDHGIDAELDEFAPGRANVVARLKGDGGRPGLIFSAHFDTVPVGAQPWSHGPFAAEVVGGRLYGRGASDMKSGMAAMIRAAVALRQSNAALAGDLILAFSAGESSNCLGAKRMVARGDLKGAGHFLVSEPTSLGILIAEKGALWLRLIAHGRGGHASAAEGSALESRSAITRMMAALQTLESLRFDIADHPLLGAPSLAVGTIRGGSVVNLTPDRCEAEIDLRLLPGQDPKGVIASIAEHVGDDIEIETIDYKPPVETAPQDPFVGACVEACRAVGGHAPVPAGVSYYSDATVICPALDLPMVILGPGELGMSGQTDEYVELAKLEEAVPIFERVARTMLAT
jgi:succinyl-diaminopimelate desuccinylase